MEDFPALPHVLSKITEYKGRVVPDEVFRHGRRAAKWETYEMSTSDKKAKPRSLTRMLALHAPCCAPELGCDLTWELMPGVFRASL